MPDVSTKMQSWMSSVFKSRFNLFYLLVFAPLILIVYSGFIKRGDVVTWIIPFYGFLLLYIKKDKLTVFAQADSAFRVIGLVLIVASFFVYYVVVRFYPPAQFYGVTNYTFHVLGLFLVFFELRALREAFTPLLLIVGAAAVPFLGAGLEVSLWPAIPFFVQVIGLFLKVMNIPATLVGSNVFALKPLNSSVVSLSVSPACIGIYGVLTYSILIMVTLIEDPSSSLRTKLFWAIGGAVGSFFVNLIRVSTIFVVIYYFGYENWPVIHAPLGYALFLTWIGCFFLVFSKRQTIKNAFQSLLKKSKRDVPPANL